MDHKLSIAAERNSGGFRTIPFQKGHAAGLLVTRIISFSQMRQTAFISMLKSDQIVMQSTSQHNSTCGLSESSNLRALAYDILPVTDYAIGLEKLSTNGQFFVGARKAVPL